MVNHSGHFNFILLLFLHKTVPLTKLNSDASDPLVSTYPITFIAVQGLHSQTSGKACANVTL